MSQVLPPNLLVALRPRLAISACALQTSMMSIFLLAGSIGRNMILNWWCLQHPYKDSSAKHRKVQQVIDKGWAPPECPTKEHRYTGYEGAREVLEVLQHLNEAKGRQRACGTCIHSFIRDTRPGPPTTLWLHPAMCKGLAGAAGI